MKIYYYDTNDKLLAIRKTNKIPNTKDKVELSYSKSSLKKALYEIYSIEFTNEEIIKVWLIKQ